MQGNSDGSAGRPMAKFGGSAATAGMLATAGLLALGAYGVYVDRDVTIGLGGGKSISIGTGDEFTDVLDDALAEARGETEALLAQRNFYNIESPQLVDVIENIDGESETYATLRDGLRQVLWNLQGPYSEGALRGADESFLDALIDLDTALRERQEVYELLYLLWERSIEQRRPFEKLRLKAQVTVLPDSPATRETIFACPQNAILHDKYIKILPPVAGGGDVELKVRASEALFPCDTGPVPRGPDILGGTPARLAIPEHVAWSLYGPERAGPLPVEPIAAEFYLRPAFLASSGLLEVTFLDQGKEP